MAGLEIYSPEGAIGNAPLEDRPLDEFIQNLGFQFAFEGAAERPFCLGSTRANPLHAACDFRTQPHVRRFQVQ